MRYVLVSLLLVLLGAAARAQNADGSAPPDPMDRPTEAGLRFTPGMARALGKAYAKNLLVRRYELGEDKVDEAAEKVARRLMDLAHKNQEHGQQLIEFAMAEAVNEEAKSNRNGPGGLTPRMGKGIAEHMLPMMPSLRELVGGVTQDIRPMLSFKQQLKLSADSALAATALDAFDKTMQRWSSGNVQPFENPFQSSDPSASPRDADGETYAMKSARRTAERVAAEEPWKPWEAYVQAAKEFYQFDASQAGTADSILREYTDRARTVWLDQTLQAQAYRNRLWSNLSMQLPGGWNSPLRLLLEKEYADVSSPVTQLGNELKDRIEQIPTAAQRTAAEERVDAAILAKSGGRRASQPAVTSAEGVPQP